MSIGPDSVGPSACPSLPLVSPPWGRPYGNMVVQEVRKVVLNEIFAGHTEVNRVPV